MSPAPAPPARSRLPQVSSQPAPYLSLSTYAYVVLAERSGVHAPENQYMCALTVEASAGSVTVGLVAPGVLRCLNRHERSAAIAVAIYVYVVRFGAGSDEVEDAAVVDKWIAAGRSANRRIV